MAGPETRIQRNIQKKLKEHFGFDIFVFKVWGSEHMMAGLPDLIGCFRGRFFGLEVKTLESRSNVSPRQQYVGGLIQQAGGAWAVVTSPAESIAALEALAD